MFGQEVCSSNVFLVCVDGATNDGTCEGKGFTVHSSEAGKKAGAVIEGPSKAFKHCSPRRHSRVGVVNIL